MELRHAFLCVAALSCAAAVAGSGSTSSEANGNNAEDVCSVRAGLRTGLEARPDLTWQEIRSACDAAIDKLKISRSADHAWFVNAGNGFVGVPLVLLKVLPDLAPDIWGSPDESFATFGLFPDPDQPDRILPRGLGVTGSLGRPIGMDNRPTGEIDYGQPQALYVTLACGACHTGQIDLGGRRYTMDGAPNTQFDVRKWRNAFSVLRTNYLSEAQIGTAEAPGTTTQKLIQLIRSKPKGFFARGLPQIREDQIAAVDEAQRTIFIQNAVRFLTGLAQSAGIRAAAVELQTRPGSSYGHGENSPGLAGFSAGQSDGSGDLLADLIAGQAARDGRLSELLKGPLPEGLPRFATVTDAPAVWNQGDRSVGQWDGSVLERFWRNIAAQLPIVGAPEKIDLRNASIAAEYLMGLPAAPYPLDVQLTKAARGEELFAQNCGSCHRPRNDSRYPQVGTDMNRARVLDATGSAMFLAAFRAACHDTGFGYTDSHGRYQKPCTMPAYRILRDTTQAANQGYLAPPLDGLWARAPYLHNGSVPTLAHLLKPNTRPRTFLRGVIAYDSKNVGWVWKPENLKYYSRLYPTVSIHDTRRDGWSNQGHDRDVVVDGRLQRLDWSDPKLADDFDALLEYLKTL